MTAMPAISLLARNNRTGVLWNATDHAVQLARLGRLDEPPLVVDLFHELPVGDDEAVEEWLRRAFPERGPGYLAAFAGFHPPERVLLRETVNSRRLAEPSYLPTFLAEQAKLYREGDVIQVQLSEEPIYLRLREVTRNYLTLALNEAEMPLKF
jgi:hypothetical protein